MRTESVALTDVISGVKCSALVVANANLSTTVVTFETFVNVSCQHGYEFNVSQYWVVTRCQADKTWSLQLNNCSRKYLPEKLDIRCV